MWERTDYYPSDPELQNITTSIWEYENVLIVGVMRPVMLNPPYLWAQIFNTGYNNVRLGRHMLDELQRLIYSPVVYAEAESNLPRNNALLKYLGFSSVLAENNRTLYERSL